MKKTLLIIFAIALLGIAGVAAKSHKSDQPASLQNSTAAPLANSQAGDNNSTPDTALTYKDGTYTGGSEPNPYGTVQVAVVVSGGKITDINFLQMPNGESESQQITNDSAPLLKQSALSKQSASIDFVSGATVTSQGFEQSLQAALNQAAS
jgi:uncharacterized protein with FMN-binding domain